MIWDLIGFISSKVDDVVYSVANMIDPIPPHEKKEYLDDFVYRIEPRHALRYLKYRISKHRSTSIDTEEETVARYHRKSDKKAIRTLFTLLRKIQDEEERLYNRIRMGYGG